MTISKLKALLDDFDDDDEISVAITVNDKVTPVITYDIGIGQNERGGLELEVSACDADFDYHS